ncbi:MAG: hypothetical protein IJW37_00340 [Lachnospiraceae bacterium]|nr:hypothetical protein [Lachnospiraceae bacterium]
MEKKHFITLLMTVIGGMLFSLGMCMCLLPEWGMFNQGLVVGAIGAVELLVTLFVYRKLAGKKPMKINAKLVGKVLYGMFAAIVFGLGMCMVMVFEGMMIWGILIGIIGIVLLLCLIPMCVGLKDGKTEQNKEN